MQDPALVADGTSIRVVWAGERTGGDHNLRLFTDTLSVAPPGGLEQLELEVLEETCPSIRSPAIVPLVGSDPAEWLVFYVCTNAGSSEVHAARGPLTALTRTSIVLGAAELGTVAANGVRDIAAVAFNYAVTPATTPPTRRPTYRLWLLTHGTESTVSFVEGTAVMGGLPTFVPYAGNPIFTATEPDLGPCLGRCELHGIAATRVPGVPTRVQLMVERWDPGSATAPFALIPLRQSWPSDVP